MYISVGQDLSFFSLLNIVISPLVLAQLSQVIISVSFFLKREVGLTMHNPVLSAKAYQ